MPISDSHYAYRPDQTTRHQYQSLGTPGAGRGSLRPGVEAVKDFIVGPFVGTRDAWVDYWHKWGPRNGWKDLDPRGIWNDISYIAKQNGGGLSGYGKTLGNLAVDTGKDIANTPAETWQSMGLDGLNAIVATEAAALHGAALGAGGAAGLGLRGVARAVPVSAPRTVQIGRSAATGKPLVKFNLPAKTKADKAFLPTKGVVRQGYVGTVHRKLTAPTVRKYRHDVLKNVPTPIKNTGYVLATSYIVDGINNNREQFKGFREEAKNYGIDLNNVLKIAKNKYGLSDSLGSFDFDKTKDALFKATMDAGANVSKEDVDKFIGHLYEKIEEVYTNYENPAQYLIDKGKEVSDIAEDFVPDKVKETYQKFSDPKYFQEISEQGSQNSYFPSAVNRNSFKYTTDDTKKNLESSNVQEKVEKQEFEKQASEKQPEKQPLEQKNQSQQQVNQSRINQNSRVFDMYLFSKF